MNRRDFLKLSGAAAGGIILNACHSGGDGGPSPVPNGYRFYRVAGPGFVLPDGSSVIKVGEGSMMNRNGDIVLFADTSAGKAGMYELRMDYAARRPAIGASRKVVATGDAIGGFPVGRICYGGSNKAGHYACVLKMTGGLNGVYADRDGTGMQPVVLPTVAIGGTNDPEFFFHGHFGDVDLDDEGNLLAKVTFNREGGAASLEGILRVDGAGTRSMLAEEGAELPGGNEVIAAFGLFDLANNNGHYAAQVFGSGDAAARRRPGSTSAVRGRLSRSFLRATTIAASANAALRGRLRTAALVGDVRCGPRIGSDGQVAQVLHPTENHPVLYLDGQEIIARGGLSPLGNVVSNIGGPIITGSNVLYVMLECAESSIAELCVYDGATLRTYLTSGDPVEASDRKVPIKAFAFGVLRDMMDDTGKLVMTGAFDDGNYLVVGIPY